MATTATSARPAIEPRGTIGGRVARLRRDLRAIGAEVHHAGRALRRSRLIDMQPALMQHHAPRVVLIHQRDIVGRDNHRRCPTC